MEVSQQNPMNPATYCMLCFGVGTSRCGRCHNAYYCSRQHQIDHWATHKKVCKKQEILHVQNQILPLNPQVVSNNHVANFSEYNEWCQSNLSYDKNNAALATEGIYNAAPCNNSANSDKIIDFQLSPEEEVGFSSFGSEVLSSDNNFWDIINACDAQNIFDFGTDSEKEQAIQRISEALQTGAPTPQPNEFRDNQLINDMENMGLMQGASLHDICSNVVHDLSTYGICVLDKFLGIELGSKILHEVKNLYDRGIFQKGQLVNPSHFSKEIIRKDVTTWVNGTEPSCNAIGNLIKKLDVVITTCNKLPNNGLLSKYKLHRRTKAMIACYPGDGTYYKKHVDNPNKDGRCITCIYYLNQNWNTEQHGGLLRMFPAAHETQVANIEPVFDRMIFFWSDKRNPHEVLPAFATRFAITVWYFDADERDGALSAAKGRSLKTRQQYNLN